jgi:hypothetical protein
MIEQPNRVVLGRSEDETPDNKWAHHFLHTNLESMHSCWAARWPETAQKWNDWNVAELVGPFGRWYAILLQSWSGLGDRVAPVMKECMVYIPTFTHLDPLPLDESNLPVLHQSWRLFSSDEVKSAHGWWKPLKGWRDRLYAIEKQLDNMGILHHPHGTRLRGWKHLLRSHGVEIKELGKGRFELLKNPPELNMNSVGA